MGSAGNSYSDLSKIYSKDFESEKINSDKKSISKKYSWALIDVFELQR